MAIYNIYEKVKIPTRTYCKTIELEYTFYAFFLEAGHNNISISP